MTVTVAPPDSSPIAIEVLADAFYEDDALWHRRQLRPLLGPRLDRIEVGLGLLEPGGEDGPETQRRKADLEQELTQAFDELLATPASRVMLVCFLSLRLFDAWDRDINHGQILDVTNIVDRAILAHLDSPEANDVDPTSAAEQAIIDYLRVYDICTLRLELDVEEAVNAGCATAALTNARAVMERQRGEDETLDALPQDEFESLVETLRRRAADNANYYESIARAAEATGILISQGPSGVSAANEALGKITEHQRKIDAGDADEDSGNSSWASEIRAHAGALDQLRELVEKPQLRIDEGELTYLYPFSLFGAADISADSLASELRDENGEWSGRPLGGLEPQAFEPVLVTDTWRRFSAQSALFVEDLGSGEPSDHAGDDQLPARAGVAGETFVFDGHILRLPDLVLDLAAEQPAIEFEASILITRAGTHAVKFTTELADAGPHEIYRAIRRADKRLAGDRLKVDGDDGGTDLGAATDLRSFAKQIARDLAAVVESTKQDLIGRGKLSGTNADSPVRAVWIPESEHHLLIQVSAMSRCEGEEAVAITADELVQELDSGEEVIAGARLLTSELSRDTTALEEWVRTPVMLADDVSEDLDLAGERIHALQNVTVLLMTQSPRWLASEYSEAAELVAILPPMFSRWREELDETVTKAQPLVSEVRRRGHRKGGEQATEGRVARFLTNEANPLAPEPLQKRLKEVRDRQLEVRTLAGRARGLLARYRSDEICKAAQHRLLLDSLMEAYHIVRLEESLNRRLELTDELLDGIEVDLAKDYEGAVDARARRFEQAVGGIGAVLAVLALADLFSFFHGGYELERYWVLIFIAVILILALVVGYFVRKSLSSDIDPPKRVRRRTTTETVRS